MKTKMIVGFVLRELRITALFLVAIQDFVLCVPGKWKTVLFVRWTLPMRRNCGRFDENYGCCHIVLKLQAFVPLVDR